MHQPTKPALTAPGLPPVSQPGLWRRLVIVLAVVGPGIVTSNVDNDAGGITTYSLAGAEFGLSLLWTLLPITLVLIMVQEMSARMGAISGKGLSGLIRERFGAAVTFYLMIGLILINLGNTVSEFAGVAAGMELFGVHRYLSVPAAAFLVWFLVIKGSYKAVEKVFLIACLFYAAYIITGFLVKPDWGLVRHEVLQPSLSLSPKAMVMVVGLVGTTIAPWMQFYLQSAVVDKGLTAKDYRIVRWDVITGSVTVSVVAFFIILVCAATLFTHSIHIETARDAALALAPLSGRYASELFGLGLLNASLFSASILPLSTAYTVCEAFGWESSVDKKFVEAPQFYTLYSLMIALGAGIIMWPGLSLIPIMYLSQVLNGIVLPVILFFMLWLINDREVMGDYINGRVSNFIAWITIILLTALSLVMIVLVIL
jgi:NRAMP (natural resistance-associated macrophage protein)-like metal ion transporter